MKAKSKIKLGRQAFDKMKRVAPSLLQARRQRAGEPDRVRRLPEEIAFKLTNRCNLRCKHCYQWNEEGHHHDLDKIAQKQDLDFAIVEKVFAETRELASNVYLWGGEPLIYRDWDRLVDLLQRDPRWTAMCTNGLGTEKKLDSILRISERLEILFAIEGFRDEHDFIRGNGTFDRVMHGIDLLLEEKRAGRFRGEVAVNFVITDRMVPRIYEFLETMERKGLDTLYLSLLWFISHETSRKMDDYVVRHFNWLCTENETGRPSWHAYKYRLEPGSTERLIDELARVDARTWKFKLRYNPAVDPHEVGELVSGSDRPVQGKTRCLSIKSRMDIFPDGGVVSCKFFPEFKMGSLETNSVAELWQGEPWACLRRTIDEEGLMPVCSKCNLLYSRGI